MMNKQDSEYSFILDNMNFSYSSASTFNTCPYGFYLTYIQCEDREANAFSGYGLLCHKIFELYFLGELNSEDMADYFIEHYDEYVNVPFPPSAYVDMNDLYYKDGLEYFKNFEFNRDDYEVVAIEEKIPYTYRGISLTITADAVIREKSSGKIIMIDFKSGKLKFLKNGNLSKSDDKKVEGYKHQMQLYAKILHLARDIILDEIQIWFIRGNQVIKISTDAYDIENSIQWFEDMIDAIYSEKEWKANNTQENKFFCDHLCSVKNSCSYRESGQSM